MTGTEPEPRGICRAQHSPSVGTHSVLRLPHHQSSGSEIVSQVHKQWLCSEKARVMPGPWDMFQHRGRMGQKATFLLSYKPSRWHSKSGLGRTTDSLSSVILGTDYSPSPLRIHLWPWSEQDKEQELKNHGPIGTKRPSSTAKET